MQEMHTRNNTQNNPVSKCNVYKHQLCFSFAANSGGASLFSRAISWEQTKLGKPIGRTKGARFCSENSSNWVQIKLE